MKDFSFHYLTVALALGCTLAGCSPPRDGQIVVAIDLSDPEPSRLLRYADIVFKSQRRFASFTCIVYAADADVVYEGPSIHDRSRFNETLGAGIAKPREGLRAKGTNHLSALALAGKLTADNGSVLLVLTDGGQENPEHGMAKGMEQVPASVALYVFGVLPEHRDELLELPLGRSVIVRSLTDADPSTVEVAR